MQTNDKYILDKDGNVVPERDLLSWAKWFEDSSNRIVKADKVGDVRVSTIFLGIDHNFGDGAPVLWETMIFGGEHDGYQDRYTSREDALAGHEKALTLANLKKLGQEGE